MTYSRGFKLFLIAALPISLLWKLTVQPGDPQDFGKKLAAFLDQQRFAVSTPGDSLGGMQAIRATAEKCRMVALTTSSLDADWDIVRSLAAGDDHVFVVSHGKTYRDPPRWLTLTDYLWSRLLRELGVVRHQPPVLAVVASPACHAERLPWHELWDQAEF